MLSSGVTSKGQTTIPKEIREFLGLSKDAMIFYLPNLETKNVTIRAVSGGILGLRGAVPSKGAIFDVKEQRKASEEAAVERYLKTSRQQK